MCIGEVFGIIFIFYLIGIIISMGIGIVMHGSNSDWKYAKEEYTLAYPILLYCIPRDLIVNFNNYLNTNNLKK